MPGMCCSVPECHLRGDHEFPNDKERRKSRINAIKRLDQTTFRSWETSKTAVCVQGPFHGKCVYSGDHSW